MPLYHLRLVNDLVRGHSQSGHYRDDDEACSVALLSARELVAERIRAGLPVNKSHHIDVAKPDGEIVQTVHFQDVIDLRP